MKKVRRAARFGRISEWRCVLYYRLRGYRIAAMRYRTRFGEIDVIAKKRNTVVFVEVRARRHKNDTVFLSAAESIDTHKQARIVRSAQVFLRKNSRYHGYTCRFDVFVCEGKRFGRARRISCAFDAALQ